MATSENKKKTLESDLDSKMLRAFLQTSCSIYKPVRLFVCLFIHPKDAGKTQKNLHPKKHYHHIYKRVLNLHHILFPSAEGRLIQ
jgi:hypothetical protein